MRPVMHDLSISGLQADALFASRLQRCDEPSDGQVRQAIATAIRDFGYSGCAARVAQEFGDHPETASDPYALGPRHGRRSVRGFGAGT